MDSPTTVVYDNIDHERRDAAPSTAVIDAYADPVAQVIGSNLSTVGGAR